MKETFAFWGSLYRVMLLLHEMVLVNNNMEGIYMGSG